MKRSDIGRLRELLDHCEGHKCYKAQVTRPARGWGLTIQLGGEILRLWSDQPWIVEDWPTLDWIGSCFFHRSRDGVYLVHGTNRAFDHAIYRPRLRPFKKMVQWAIPKAAVGFTVLDTVSEHWGHTLISPWLIKSTDPVWLQRLKMFQALNQHDPIRWPMELMIEKWSAFREIRF